MGWWVDGYAVERLRPTWCIGLVVGGGCPAHLELALAVASAPHGSGVAWVVGHRIPRLVTPAVGVSPRRSASRVEVVGQDPADQD